MNKALTKYRDAINRVFPVAEFIVDEQENDIAIYVKLENGYSWRAMFFRKDEINAHWKRHVREALQGVCEWIAFGESKK